MSQQLIDGFGREEEQIKDDEGESGEIHFARDQTGVPIVLATFSGLGTEET